MLRLHQQVCHSIGNTIVRTSRFTLTKEAPCSCSKKKRTYTSMWDRWTNDQVYRESQLAHDWSDAFVNYLYHIAAIDIPFNDTQEQRGRYSRLLHLRASDDDRQGPPFATRPGNKEAKNLLSEVQRETPKEMVIAIHSKN